VTMMDQPPATPPAPPKSPTPQPAAPKPGGRKRRRVPRPVRDAVIILIIVSAVRLLDPFGIDEGLTERVGDIVVNVLSGWYPATGQDQITVVLIDDAYIRYKSDRAPTGEPGWPLSLYDHEAILSQLYEAGAKSIFFDLIFAYQRGGPDAAKNFADLIAAISRGRPASASAPATPGVPILLADIFDSAIPARHCNDPGRDLPDGMVLADIACSATAVVPVTLSINHDSYPAASTPGCNKQWPTPAFAQFRLDGYADPLGCGSNVPEWPALYLRWGRAVSQTMAVNPYVDQNCRYRQDHRSFYHPFEIALTAFVGNAGYIPHPERCRYTNTISALDLFSNDVSIRQRVSRLISGHYVLVGTDMSGDTDRVRSPVSGDIPGVYVHAMALDNLLVAQAESPQAKVPAYYKVESDDPFWIKLDSWVAAVVIGIWIASEGLIEGLAGWISNRQQALTDPAEHTHHGGIPWVVSFFIRLSLLGALLYTAERWDFIELPVTLGIVVTVLVVETSLKLAMGVVHLSKDEVKSGHAHEPK
jgi:hypothetical protein